MLAFVMANLIPKTPPETWVNLAKRALVEDGINGVKVDRLAQRLGVTRGGFYKHFTDRGDLLVRLLELWEQENIFALPVWSKNTSVPIPRSTPPPTQRPAAQHSVGSRSAR